MFSPKVKIFLAVGQGNLLEKRQVKLHEFVVIDNSNILLVLLVSYNIIISN